MSFVTVLRQPLLAGRVQPAPAAAGDPASPERSGHRGRELEALGTPDAKFHLQEYRLTEMTSPPEHACEPKMISVGKLIARHAHSPD